jgi:hypothetical protein
MNKILALFVIILISSCSKSEQLLQSTHYGDTYLTYDKINSDTTCKSIDTSYFKPLDKPIIFDVIVDEWSN